MSRSFRVDDRGAWSGGGGAFLANWHSAALSHPRLAGGADAVVVIPRNVPVERLPRRPFVLVPQNAWPWVPVTSGTRERLRHASLRVAGAAYARACAAQLRISSVVPRYFPDERSSPVIHNVLDPGFEVALQESARTAPLPGCDGAFVCLGSVTGYRNLELLLDAYADYRADGGSSGLLLAGPPTNRALAERLRRRCDELPGASVRWGRASRATVLATLASARGVVLPSLVEASPLSLLEAVTVTPAVLASDIPGHREILAASAAADADADSDDGEQAFVDARSREALRSGLHGLERGSGLPHAHRRLRRRDERDGARERWAAAVDDWLRALVL